MSGASQVLPVVLPLLVGAALISIASVVAKHGWRQRHNRFFSLLYFLSGLDSVSEGLAPVANGLNAKAPLFPDAAAWVVLGRLCVLAMTPMLLLFVASFPRPVGWMVRRPALGALLFLPSLLVGAAIVLVTDPALQFQVAVLYAVLNSVLTAAALALLARSRAGSPDPIEKQQAKYVIVGFLPSFIATWAITTLYLMFDFGQVSGAVAQYILDNVVGVVSPLFELVAALFVAFAILKFQLLGVNPRFRLGVKSTLIGGMLVLVFFFTQFVENLFLQTKVFAFAGRYSFVFSGVAGLVLFKPIHSVSTKVSNRVLPPEAEQGPLSRAAEVYHAQCTYVLRDAQVTDRELEFLRNLRQQLGLSDAEAAAIEERVERLLKVDDPRTGKAATGAHPAGAMAAQASREMAATAPVVHRASPDPTPTPAPAPSPPTPAKAPPKRAAAKAPAKAASGAGKPKTPVSSGKGASRKAPVKAADKPAKRSS